MSEELSRLKSRQKKRSGEGKTSGKSKKTNPRSEGAPKKSNHSRTTTATLSRKARRPAASAKGSNAGNKEQEESVPSRSNTYSSERVRLSKMFVNSLIFIFVILLVALLWWGIEGAPPLRTLW
jgi:cobalamin biosynthesis Mg chelatase CobN